MTIAEKFANHQQQIHDARKEEANKQLERARSFLFDTVGSLAPQIESVLCNSGVMSIKTPMCGCSNCFEYGTYDKLKRYLEELSDAWNPQGVKIFWCICELYFYVDTIKVPVACYHHTYTIDELKAVNIKKD